jgi:glycosyltransferase involved in cell wall biosynthesis
MTLVSAIMPTRGRPEMASRALDSCLAQLYRPLEIVIADDTDDQSFPDSAIRDWKGVELVYLRLPKMKIGEKRNRLCEQARGEIIVHIDSDDWSAPTRITDQVERLLSSGKAVSGYHSMLFWDGEQAFRYQGIHDYSVGSALCYRRDFWQQHPFVAEHRGRWEDNVFVQQARNDNQIIAVDAGQLMVARIHAGNTAPKKPRESPRQWAAVDRSEIPEAFFQWN